MKKLIIALLTIWLLIIVSRTNAGAVPQPPPEWYDALVFLDENTFGSFRTTVHSVTGDDLVSEPVIFEDGTWVVNRLGGCLEGWNCDNESLDDYFNHGRIYCIPEHVDIYEYEDLIYQKRACAHYEFDDVGNFDMRDTFTIGFTPYPPEVDSDEDLGAKEAIVTYWFKQYTTFVPMIGK